MLVALFLFTAAALTQQQYDQIVSDVRTQLEPPASDYVNQADFFGGVVRLPFHDAGSYDQSDGSGKPSGCVNPFDPANGGLPEVINGIEPVYQLHKTELSRADYWVIVGTTAILDAGGPSIPFKWGRVDCTSYPPTGRLPDAEKNWTEVNDVFVQRMGLTTQDIVALLGAHALGRAMPENSGYQFYWTPSANKFSNQLYTNLLYLTWKRNSNYFAFHGNTNQWDNYPPPDGADPFMMLNTDVSLVWGNVPDGSIDGPCKDTGDSSCAYNEVTIDLVKTYAGNQTRWFADFSTAWQKMTSLGWTNLQPLQ